MSKCVSLFSIPLLVGALVGCGESGENVVATIVDEEVMVNGYLNQATADYAECLEGAGLVVSPEDDKGANNLIGYATVDGAAFALDEAGAAVEGANYPIAVDGENRDVEVRECYEANPGAKDTLIDMGDFVAADDSAAIPDGEIAAGIVWARCARGVGVAEIRDPNKEGIVVIPEGVSFDQAKTLGKECSAPMAEDEYWPRFRFDAGVKDPESGMVDMTPFAEVIDGPFLDSDKAKKYREENPG